MRGFCVWVIFGFWKFQIHDQPFFMETQISRRCPDVAPHERTTAIATNHVIAIEAGAIGALDHGSVIRLRNPTDLMFSMKDHILKSFQGLS